jgi:hypothetical protein
MVRPQNNFLSLNALQVAATLESYLQSLPTFHGKNNSSTNVQLSPCKLLANLHPHFHEILFSFLTDLNICQTHSFSCKFYRVASIFSLMSATSFHVVPKYDFLWALHLPIVISLCDVLPWICLTFWLPRRKGSFCRGALCFRWEY